MLRTREVACRGRKKIFLTFHMEGNRQVFNNVGLYEIHSEFSKESEIVVYRETGRMLLCFLLSFIKSYSLIVSYICLYNAF